MSFCHTPGAALAVCGPRIAVLTDLDPSSSIIVRLLDLVGNPDTSLDEVLEVLISDGLRSIADFAVAESTDGEQRVVVRGRFTAKFAAGEPVVARGLWTDRTQVGTVARLLADEPNESAEWLPVIHGIVRAAAVATLDAASAPRPDKSARADAVPAEDFADGAHEPGEAPSEPDTPAPESATPAPEPATPAAEPASSVPPGGFPHGHTLPAMILPPDAFAEPTAGASPAASQEEPPAATFIDSIPWAAADTEAVDGQTITPDERRETEADLNQLTVNRGSLGTAQRDPAIPTVVAARCSRGHLSPAYAGQCRVCGEQLPPQQPFETARPSLGVLRFSNGDVVVLDRGCVLGRNPRIPTGHVGEVPHLVRLHDPDKDISSQHLLVSLDYWHVLVTDLGSTNGTEVVPPGEAPTSLRPDDAVTIEPGTTVVLAGVLSFTFEVTP